MVGRLSCPKVSGGTAVVLSESNAVGNEIVSESVGGGGIVPVYGDYDNVGLGGSKDCALESLRGSGISVGTALSALSLLALCVLININQSLVSENSFRGWWHACHVLSEDKRSLGNSP